MRTEITPHNTKKLPSSRDDSEDRDTIVNAKSSSGAKKNFESLINSSQSINQTLKNLDKHTENLSKDGIKKEEMMEIILLHRSLKDKIKYLEDRIEKF